MTIKSYIIEYLRTRKNLGFDYTAGGTIERYLMDFLPTKGGTIERTCRNLAEEKILEKKYIKINNKEIVTYKLNIL